MYEGASYMHICSFIWTTSRHVGVAVTRSISVWIQPHRHLWVRGNEIIKVRYLQSWRLLSVWTTMHSISEEIIEIVPILIVIRCEWLRLVKKKKVWRIRSKNYMQCYSSILSSQENIPETNFRKYAIPPKSHIVCKIWFAFSIQNTLLEEILN